MAKFFISYRRRDAQYQAHKLHETLSSFVANPREDIFIDVDNIPFGRDFVAHLDAKVRDCEVLLAVIGPQWLDLRDSSTGMRLLDDPNDFVRIEIESALERDIPVVPVLLDGVSVPRASDLPKSLQPLVRRNGIPVQLMTFEADVARLMRGLGYSNLTSPTLKPPPQAERKPDEAAELRKTWDSFPARENIDEVTKFLARVSGASPGAGLEFEVEHQLRALRGEAERHATELSKAEARRHSEDAARRAEVDRRERTKRAVEAAHVGKSVVERTFVIDLSDVANWPAPEMIVIPPGRFLMGAAKREVGASADENPQHEVEINYPFALGRQTVTFAEWDAAQAAGANLKSRDDRGWGRANRPVINVDRNDVLAYLFWLNDTLGLAGQSDAYRLPSESEWEYAARAGTATPFSFGATISTHLANYDGNSAYGHGQKGENRKQTMPVGSFPANSFGLYDMHGNVGEMMQDCWNPNYQGAPSDGSAWVNNNGLGRTDVLRGGSWFNGPRDLRSASRTRVGSSHRDSDTGFRVARTL